MAAGVLHGAVVSILAGLLLMAAVAAVAVRTTRTSHGPAPTGQAGGTLRRLLQYVLLLVALFGGASGVARVLTALMPTDPGTVGPGPAELALGLSLTLVAVPSWMLLWRPVRRRLIGDVDERDPSPGRSTSRPPRPCR